MEHSVGAYIERRSSAELLSFLELCLYKGQWDQYSQTIPLIFATLQHRNVPIPEQIRAAWEQFIAE